MRQIFSMPITNKPNMRIVIYKVGERFLFSMQELSEQGMNSLAKWASSKITGKWDPDEWDAENPENWNVLTESVCYNTIEDAVFKAVDLINKDFL